jgi:4-hydroxythreonine-4-phosphate dehydrogenase
MQTTAAEDKPVIALVMGDPSGISPELTAKIVADDAVRAKACLLVIGDRPVFDEGARIAAVAPQIETVASDSKMPPRNSGAIFVDLGHLDPAGMRRGVASRQGGEFALANYRHALTLACDGYVDAVCFTPFNKRAMRRVLPTMTRSRSRPRWSGLQGLPASSTCSTGCGTRG